MRILYFAWLRQKTGIDSEEVEMPSHITDVAGLIEWLKGRNENFAEALSDFESIRVADARMVKKSTRMLRKCHSYLCAKFQIDRDRYRACTSIFLRPTRLSRRSDAQPTHYVARPRRTRHFGARLRGVYGAM